MQQLVTCVQYTRPLSGQKEPIHFPVHFVVGRKETEVVSLSSPVDYLTAHSEKWRHAVTSIRKNKGTCCSWLVIYTCTCTYCSHPQLSLTTMFKSCITFITRTASIISCLLAMRLRDINLCELATNTFSQQKHQYRTQNFYSYVHVTKML